MLPAHASMSRQYRELRLELLGMQRDCLDCLIEILRTPEVPLEMIIPTEIVRLMPYLLAVPDLDSTDRAARVVGLLASNDVHCEVLRECGVVPVLSVVIDRMIKVSEDARSTMR